LSQYEKQEDTTMKKRKSNINPAEIDEASSHRAGISKFKMTEQGVRKLFAGIGKVIERLL
jgi:hypothetical protein